MTHGVDHASPAQRLAALVRSERADLWVLLTYAAGVGLLSLVVPVATASLVNTVSFGVVLQPLLVLTLLVLIALGFEGLMRAMQLQLVETLQRRVFVRVALDLARRLARLHASASDHAHPPELVNRFFDVMTVQKSFATLLLDGLAIVLQTLIGTLLLAFYHPLLLAFDAVLVLGMAVVLWPLGAGAIETSLRESHAKYAVAAWLEELAHLGHTFRGAGAVDFAETRADQLAQQYLAARASHFRIKLRQHVGSLAFRAVVSALLLGVGGWLVIQRELTIGQLAAAELVVGAIVFGITKLSKQLESAYDLAVAVDKLGHLVELPVEREGGAPVPAGSPRGAQLELREVTFSHGLGVTLDAVSIALDPGSRVAVLGSGGSGKSTLADLIEGRRAPQTGAVLLEGVDLRELALDSVRTEVAVVRDVEIFAGTVADNVAVGRIGVDAERVRAALVALRLDGAVLALRDGAATTLTPIGTPLSETQARLLMFARAMAGSPRLLVVDGALDGLDPEAAGDALDALTAADAPWTLLVLTHNTTTAARCPIRLRLRGAHLVPTGA